MNMEQKAERNNIDDRISLKIIHPILIVSSINRKLRFKQSLDSDLNETFFNPFLYQSFFYV